MTVPLPTQGDTDWYDWASQVDVLTRNAISPQAYGALGNGTTNDSTALQTALSAAVSSGQPLQLGKSTYIATGLVATGPVRIVGQGAVIKAPAGSIVNTDASHANFTPILRVQGAQWCVLDGVTFDGNRDAQTYPATANTFGRGSRPWRHNATVEFTPATDNTTPARHVSIRSCAFINGYLSGLALWQCENVTVGGGTRFATNTWSGIVGAGLTDVVVENVHGFQNGSSTVYTQARQDGDRATVQFREYDKAHTSATEGLPTIGSSTSRLNAGIRIANIHSVQDAVEGVFLRACRDARITGCRVVDPGYQRPTAASFYPGGLWCEWGSFTIDHNTVYCPTVVDTVNYLPADGIVCYSFSGDAVEPVMAEGTYVSTVEANTIHSGQESPLASGVATDNANKKNNLYRGIRVNSNVMLRGNVIEGTSSFPIYVINETTFGSVLPINVQIDGGFIRNWLAAGAIYFVRGSSPTVAGGRIIVTNTRVEDGRNPNSTLTANAIVLFDTNLDGQVFEEISITGNDWDCANSAYSSNPYMGVRQRGASTSRALRMSSNTIRGAYRGFSIASGASLEMSHNILVDCGALFLASLSTAVGAWTCQNNTITGATFAVGVFIFNSLTVARFVFTGNHIQGTGNVGFQNWTVGDANITVAALTNNLVREPASFDWRRTVTAAPTLNAWHVGEILNRTDAAPHSYLAVTVGNGAGDWAPLAA